MDEAKLLSGLCHPAFFAQLGEFELAEVQDDAEATHSQGGRNNLKQIGLIVA